MTFQAALARCIEALERDESVEACLAAWPDFADQLEPLLRIVGHLHRSRQIDCSPASLSNRREFEAILASSVEAFADGQSIESMLTSHPQYAVRLEPLLRVVEGSHNIHKPRPLPALAAQTRTQTPEILLPSTLVPVRKPQATPVATLPVPRGTTAPQSRRFYWPRLAMVSVAASFILVASIFFNASAQSLPGDLLYPLKRGGEEVLGAATYIFGEPINWHVAQAQRRLHELALMETSGRQPDPALVAQVNSEAKVEADKALAQAATMPDAQSGPILVNWLIWIQELQSNTDQSSPAAAALAEPLATVQSALANQPAVVELMPVAAEVGTETPIAGSTPLPSEFLDPVVQSANLIPQQSEESTFTPPTATSTPRRATASATPPSAGTATAASTPADGVIEIVGIPIKTATPTPQPSAPALVSPATFTPTPPSDGNAIAIPSTASPTISPVTSVPALLPTVTNTTGATPESATPTPSPPQSTPTPTEKPQGFMPTPTPSSQPLPIVNLTPEPTKTASPTASLTPEVNDTPLPAATFTPHSTDMLLPAATLTPEPTDTASPTDTFTPEPTHTPSPTDTFTPEPTNTPSPTDTPTPEPTDTPLPTDTFTPEPTNTPLPTDTPTPEPTDTPLPTDTFTPEPTDTPLPTDTPTPEPTDTPLPTDTPTDTPLPTETP